MRRATSALSPAGQWGEHRVALEQPHHLSYPCVFSWQGQWFMVPESMAARSVELWRCVEFPCRWERDGVLFADVKAADSTIAEIEGRLWMFTRAPAEHGPRRNVRDVLIGVEVEAVALGEVRADRELLHRRQPAADPERLQNFPAD